MSSESESKGAPRLWWLVTIALLLAVVLLTGWTVFAAWSDQVVLTKPVYEELLQAVGRSLPGVAAGGVHLGFDSRFTPKSTELRQQLGGRPYPTFEELYALIVNKPYDKDKNIWRTFPNPYGLKPSFRFPFSNLRENHVAQVLQLLGRAPQLLVEVGSFHGHSAVLQSKVLDARGFNSVPLLCIDPWTGDLGMLLYRDDWDKKLTPGELADGRSTSYWQFMLNVRSQIDQGAIGAKHIVPLAVTSVVGARYLMAIGATPDIVYLDSAHEADETYAELALYFSVLADGGVVYGDDFSWDSVRNDVQRFAAEKGLKVTSDTVTWMLQKPASSHGSLVA